MKRIVFLMLLFCSSAFGHIIDGRFNLNQVFSTPNFDYWRSNGGFLGINHAACALNINDCDRFTAGTLENPRDASNANLGFAPYITALAAGETIRFFNNGGGYSYGIFDSNNQLVNDLGAVSFEKITSNYIIFKVDNWYTQIVYVNTTQTMGTSGGIINVPLGSGTSVDSWTAPATATPATPTLCCGGSAASFNADSTNTAKILTFTNRTTADSQVHIEQIGTQNVVEVNQSGTGNNYVEYYGNGLSNDVNITQTGNATTQANYVDLRVVGNFNTVDLQQTSTGGTKGIFADVSGNNNSLIIQQKDSGSHYAEVTLSGGNKNVDITQQGSAGHMAKVNLSGLPTDLSLTQSGSTQNYYSITHNCTTAGGCAKITVTQGQ